VRVRRSDTLNLDLVPPKPPAFHRRGLFLCTSRVVPFRVTSFEGRTPFDPLWTAVVLFGPASGPFSCSGKLQIEPFRQAIVLSSPRSIRSPVRAVELTILGCWLCMTGYSNLAWVWGLVCGPLTCVKACLPSLTGPGASSGLFLWPFRAQLRTCYQIESSAALLGMDPLPQLPFW
jgi:hypothetical protein